MAAGRILTGFSLPYVAKYTNSGSTVTYSQGQKLARGVSVSIEAEAEESLADKIKAAAKKVIG